MSNLVDLTYPVATECGGVVFVVGIRDGSYQIRRTIDGGQSWLEYSDSSVEKPICIAPVQQRAGLVKLRTQGRPIMVCAPQVEGLRFLISYDDGESWSEDTRL